MNRKHSRGKASPSWEHRLLLFGIPIVALLIVSVAVYANYESNRVPYQIQFDLNIEKRIVQVPSGNVTKYTISPAAHIGEHGGYMYTTQYLGDGVGGNYPIHTVDTSGIVYVDSKVVRHYTLGDFFAVWGEPLGVNNTLGIKANYTYVRPYQWSLCVRATDGGDIADPNWGNHVLSDREVIDLIYAQVPCYSY